MPRPWPLGQAWGFVKVLLESPSLHVLAETDRHRQVADELLSELGMSIGGNLLHDAHIAIILREHRIRRIYTRDSDFHRFGFLEVIDPMLSP